MKVTLPVHGTRSATPTLLTSRCGGATPSYGLASWNFGSPTHGTVSFPLKDFTTVRFPTNADAQATAFPHAGVLVTAPVGPMVFQPRVPAVVTQPAIPVPLGPTDSSSLSPAAAGKEDVIDQILAKARCPCKIIRRRFKSDLPLGGIGRGAFGTVYRAKRCNCSDDFAVKMIEDAGKMAEPIAREIEILGGLSHPSIVNMVDVIEERSQDWIFLVMEFVQGGDLLERLTRQPDLFDECLTRVLFFHISCGLAYAHCQGILHRDIKPENVLLCGDGFPKIADFGLSRRVGAGEWCKSIAGTPFYKAPEVMQNQASVYDFPADVFSAGNVLLDMLHPEVCMVGVFHLMPDKDKKRFTKNWNAVARPKFSDALQKVQKRMSDQLPGKRGSMYQTCQELLDLAQSDPMPHPFWSRQTQLPDGPPPQRNLSPEVAADIAGRRGYALHCGVNVFVEGHWCPGYVKLISETICPGALTICFQDPDGKRKESLVCPWRFDDVLRPNPKALELFSDELQKKKSGVGGKPTPHRNKKDAGSKRSSTSRADVTPLQTKDAPCCSMM